MLRLLSGLLLTLLLLTQTAQVSGAELDVSSFLATRRVLSVVYFEQGMAHLSAAARKQLVKTALELSTLDTTSCILRLEGFASPEGGDEINVNLAMERAMQVEAFLSNVGVQGRLFLIGVGAEKDSMQPPDLLRKVEVVCYDNLYQMNPFDGDLNRSNQ